LIGSETAKVAPTARSLVTTAELIRDAHLGQFGFPATVLLGPGGVIRALWIGYAPGDENAVRRAIEKELLKQAK